MTDYCVPPVGSQIGKPDPWLSFKDWAPESSLLVQPNRKPSWDQDSDDNMCGVSCNVQCTHNANKPYKQQLYFDPFQI